MRKYRRVSPVVWTDEKFCAFSRPAPNAQTLWLYLLTCDHRTIIPGVIRNVGPGTLAECLDWPVKALLECWGEIEAAGMAQADWKARLIWQPNGLKHEPPENGNQVKGWRSAFDELPPCDLTNRIGSAIQAHLAHKRKEWQTVWGTVSETVRQTVPQTVTPTVSIQGTGSREQGTGSREQGTVPRATRLATLVQRRDLNSPFDWHIPVPMKLHTELVGRESMRHGGDTSAAELSVLDWYGSVAEDWNARGELPGDDGFAFWRARYAEWRGTSRPTAGAVRQKRANDELEAWAKGGTA